MNLKNILLTGITAAGILLASYLPSKAQTVSGYITDLFNEQPIDSALVEVANLGSDYTNINGNYHIGQQGVKDFPYVITPRKTSKVDVFNVLGQRVISLDNIVEGSRLDLGNVSKGIYIVRGLDDKTLILS